MSQFTIDEVVKSYLTIRDVKRQMEKEHEEALKPVQEKLDKIETYLLGRMQEDRVDSYKTESGTAYKSVKASCQMADAAMYKAFIFKPVIDRLKGIGVPFEVSELLALPLWNLVDFRALKKGVEEYIEDHKQVPPGLNVTQTTTVNVRSK